MNGQAASFDLRHERWVPVIDLHGTCREVGLREALVAAHEFVAVFDPSPLVEIALHRLLLAVLHRALAGPRSPDAWEAIWRPGRLDEGTLDAYLDPLGSRFDLFDATRPFYQERGLVAAGLKPRPAVRLTHELASEGNAALLFDHSLAVAFEPARAARALVAHQVFSLGGLTTPPPGSSDKSSKDAPVARAAVFRVRGRTLFETLVANLVRYDPAFGVPVPGIAADLPTWERAAPPDGSTRQPTGYLDMLTWQSRRVELVAGSDGIVTGAVMLSGDRVAGRDGLHALEPTMLAFVPPRPNAPQPGPREIRLSESRALWRDSGVLLEGAGAGTTRPGVVEWALQLLLEGRPGPAPNGLVPLEVGGLVADKAKTLLWRRETLSLPVSALANPAAAEVAREALRAAERAGTLLGEGDAQDDAAGARLPRPLWQVGHALLGTKEHAARPESVRAFVRSLGAAPRYWAALGAPFSQFLAEVAAAGDPPQAAALDAATRQWIGAVREAARDAFRRAISGQAGTTRGLLAVAAGERAFNVGIARALGEARQDREVGA